MQSLDEKVWQVVEIGWTEPTEVPTDWVDAKIKAVNFNSRALNALFSAVTNEEFKKISSTATANEAWTILQKTYEGTKLVKDRSYRGSVQPLKRLRWRRMSRVMSSMLNSRT